MSDTEEERNRIARLEEDRLLVRAAATSGGIVAVITIAIAVAAFLRVHHDVPTTQVAVSGRNLVRNAPLTISVDVPSTQRPVRSVTTSTLPPPLPPDPTTTTLPPTTTTLLPPTTTVAPTTVPTVPTTVAPPVTTTTRPPTPKLVWWTSKTLLVAHPGEHVSINVAVRNDGTATGVVNAPPCVAFNGFTCTQGRPFSVAPGGSQTWSVSLFATTTGAAQGTGLTPADYAVTVGGTYFVLRVV